MADIRIEIPDTLGLSEDHIRLLREKFQSDVVEILNVKEAGNVLARAQPQLQKVQETITRLIMVDK
jgi:hypothetical protein